MKLKFTICLIVVLIFTNCSDDQCSELDCGPNGICVEGECICSEGYEGVNCETIISLRNLDSISLVNIYSNTNGDQWTYNGEDTYFDHEQGIRIETPNYGSRWDFSQPISSWHGIELNDEGTVSKIILEDCNLDGSIPEIIFSALEYFVCSNNKLKNNIPELNNLPVLKHFDCSMNQLSSQIPGLEDSKHLEYLNCSFNIISGQIPSLSNNALLEAFYCNDNQITGQIPDLINTLNLKHFYCYNNNLTGEIPELNHLLRLFTFYCGNNELTGSFPDISNLSDLWALSIPMNQLEGKIPFLENIPSLQFIFAKENLLSGCMPENPSFCNITIDFSSNVGLAWGGDYDMICDGQNQIGASCIKQNGESGTISLECNCE